MPVTAAKAGSFSLNTVTGAQAITGLGFTPVALIVWAYQVYAVSGVNEIRQAFGAGTGPTARWCLSNCYLGGTNGFTDNQFKSTDILHWNDATADNPQIVVDLTSLDTDGFTLNITTTTGSAVTVNYLAIGGTGVSAKAGYYDSLAAAGSQSITGVGFTPKFLLNCLGPYKTAETTTGVSGTTIGMAVGVGTSSYACVASHLAYGTASKAYTMMDSTARFLMSINQDGAWETKATPTSFDADGFTINWAAAPPAASRIGYLALAGSANYDLSILTEPAATGNQGKTGLTWQPSGLLLMTLGAPASATANAGIKWAVGAASSPTDRTAGGFYQSNGNTSSALPVSSGLSTRALLIPDATAGATLAEADLVSFNTDGYTLNWTKVDASAAAVVAFAFGSPQPANFAGNVLNKSTLTAGLTTDIQMAAAILGRSTLTDTTGLSTEIDMQAAILGRSTLAADLWTDPKLRGDIRMRSVLTGDFWSQVSFGGNIKGRSTAKADLTIFPAIYAADVKSKSTLSANLLTNVLLKADIAVRGTLSADLVTSVPISADIRCSSTLTAALTAPSDLISVLPFETWLQSPTRRPCLLAEITLLVNGASTVFYLSNRPYVTSEYEIPSSVVYESALIGGVKVTEKLSIDGKATISFGDIGVRNTDGSFDSWIGSNHIWSNKPIKIYVGDVTWPRYKFEKVFDGVVTDIDSKQRDQLNIKLRDKLERLNTPVFETKLGGTSSNKDRLLPLVFGEVHNIEPLLVDAATHTYQVHAGQIEDIIEVRDNGVPITVTKQLDTGKFSLVAAPAGTLTCSVQGSKMGGIYLNEIAGLVKRLVTAYGTAYERFGASEIDQVNFDAFTAANPQPVGVFVGDRANVLEVCQQFASSVGAQLCVTRGGLLQLLRVDFDFSAGTTFDITTEHMYERTLTPSERSAVIAADKVGFCKNWTVQDNLISGVVEEHKALYAQEWLTETATLPAVAADYGLDMEPPQRDTLLLTRTDAANECQRRLAILSQPRTSYTFEGVPLMMTLTLGQKVSVTHPRFGLSGKVNAVVTSLACDWSTGRTTVEITV